MRQVGLALLNYHDAFSTFPPGVMNNPDLPLERRLSWHYYLIPYAESMMDPAWRNGLNRGWDAEESRAFNSWPMRFYLCPAADHVKEPAGYGVAHYVGIAGIVPDAALLPLEDQRAGVFGYDRQTRLEDIKDGRDTTVLVMETATANGPWAAGGPSTVRGLDPEGMPYLGPDGQFSSRHRSRVTNAIFADASVRPLQASLFPTVLEALVTIAGREQVDPLPEH